MPKDAVASARSAHALLERACARNLSADIHYEHQGKLVTARLRLLAVEGERLCTDRPQRIGSAVSFHANQQVSVCFLLDGVHYAFRTRVAQTARSVQLNARQRVAGMGLWVPRHIRPRQRRSDFRVSLAGREVKASLHAVDGDNIALCPIDADRFIGRIVNISAGGIGLVVECAVRPTFALHARFYVQFDLPDADNSFVLPVEVRHFWPVCDRTATRVGLRFLCCDAVDTRSQIRSIVQFVAAEQRRTLRRGR